MLKLMPTAIFVNFRQQMLTAARAGPAFVAFAAFAAFAASIFRLSPDFDFSHAT